MLLVVCVILDFINDTIILIMKTSLQMGHQKLHISVHKYDFSRCLAEIVNRIFGQKVMVSGMKIQERCIIYIYM